MTEQPQPNIEFSKRQTEAFNGVVNGGVRYPLYGGSIRGGKTFWAIATVVILALSYPRSRWAITRKDLPTIKRNILPSFNKVSDAMPGCVGDLHKGNWTYTTRNGSEILLFPENWERDKDLNRWKGLEVNGFLHEEVNELQRESYIKSMERAGSWIIPGKSAKQPPPIVMATCNPTKNWVKQMFYDPWKVGELKTPYAYYPAQATDNPHLTKAYMENLEQMRLTSPLAYEKFVLGNWDVSEGDTFKTSMFRGHQVDPSRMPHKLGYFCDIAYTAKKTSDFCAMGLCGIAGGMKRCFEVKLARMEEDDSIPYIITKMREFEGRGLDVACYIEANSSYIKRLKDQKRRIGVKFQIIELTHKGREKADRIRGMRKSLDDWEFASTGVFDSNGIELFQHGVDQVVDQFLDWSPELIDKVPDDGPDMIAYADEYLPYISAQASDYQFNPEPGSPQSIILGEIGDTSDMPPGLL